jgi:hypothetical protein
VQEKNTKYMVAKAAEFSGALARESNGLLKDYIADQAANRCPLAECIHAAVEVGIVVPSILKAKLAEAGFTITNDVDHQDQHEALGYRTFDNLFRVLVHDASGAVVAMGASADHTDALLHAMLGYLREQDIARNKEVAQAEVEKNCLFIVDSVVAGKLAPDMGVQMLKTQGVPEDRAAEMLKG